ncbi:hypothetical protein ABZ540_35145 [Nocardia xishanensis]|uniref:hypothetical protein n=1 Tax=Nocardia xishanensis TaxID=238964 RepID=UPI0033DD6A08
MNALRRLRAKSPHAGYPHGEALTDHLSATLVGARLLHARVGRIDAVPEGFWRWVTVAALLHDAEKVPEGFQADLTGGGRRLCEALDTPPANAETDGTQPA